MMNTKLEKCLCLIQAMDESTRIELRIAVKAESEIIVAAAYDGNDGEIAAGSGNSMEEAADSLYRELEKHAKIMHEALTAFESTP